MFSKKEMAAIGITAIGLLVAGVGGSSYQTHPEVAIVCIVAGALIALVALVMAFSVVFEESAGSVRIVTVEVQTTTAASSLMRLWQRATIPSHISDRCVSPEEKHH